MTVPNQVSADNVKQSNRKYQEKFGRFLCAFSFNGCLQFIDFLILTLSFIHPHKKFRDARSGEHEAYFN